MKTRFLVAVATAALMAAPATAQTVDDEVELDGEFIDGGIDGDGGETTELGGFESLSPGNQKIAQALFDAQGQTTDGEAVDGSLSLDELAGMKQEGTGWGRLFKDLQEQGYIDSDAKNLGQLVSGKYQPEPVEPLDDGDMTTTDSGDTTTTDGEVTTAAVDGSDGATTTDGKPPANEGAFDSLSTGNQKIAKALYDAQGQTADGETTDGNLTIDDIAAMKQDGSGWGETFKEMQADGYIDSDAKNLGQLVSGRYEAPVVESDGGETEGMTDTALDGGTTTDTSTTQTSTAAGKSGNTKVANLDTGSRSQRPVVVTTANGGQISVGRGSKGKSGLDTSFDLDKATGKGGQKVAVTTAGGGGGASNFGQDKKSGVTTAGGDFTGGGASNGGGHKVSVTTAAGTSVSGGGAALGHTKAGGGGNGGGGKALGKSK
jgi:hypothetical protein